MMYTAKSLSVLRSTQNTKRTRTTFYFTLFTDHVGPEEEYSYSATLFLDLGTRRG
jgi:hypothetical protein